MSHTEARAQNYRWASLRDGLRSVCANGYDNPADLKDLANLPSWRDAEQLICCRTADSIERLPPLSGPHVPFYLKAEKDRKGNTVYRHIVSKKVVPKELVCLKELFIGCSNLKEIPALHEGLETLELWNLPQIQKIPTLPSTLKTLSLEGMPLKELPQLPTGLKELYGTEMLPAPLQRNVVYLKESPEDEAFLDPTISITYRIGAAKAAEGYVCALTEPLDTYIERYNAMWRSMQRVRRIKRQLVEAAFHPSRVGAWLDAGLSVEDM